jgi:phage terminase small subunit
MPKPNPRWYGQIAQDYYSATKKDLPPLNKTQDDLLQMMAAEWEKYLSAENELQMYAEKTGTLTCEGKQGQIVLHPLFRLQKSASESYMKAATQLRLSLSASSKNESVDLPAIKKGMLGG